MPLWLEKLNNVWKQAQATRLFVSRALQPIPHETVLAGHSSEPGGHRARLRACKLSPVPHVTPPLGLRKWGLREVKQLMQHHTGFGPGSL